MFAGLSNLPSSGHVPDPAGRSRDVPPPTPVKFPDVLPKSRAYAAFATQQPLVQFLRTVQRPGDVKIEHLEALGLHVINDVPLDDLIPNTVYLPSPSWTSIPADEIEDEDSKSSYPLNNGRPSPGAKTYVERVKELSVQNAAAFRTVRRLPAPVGETNARLGNAYEFFKNLEMLSSFWDDTSLPPAPASEKDDDAMEVDSEPPAAEKRSNPDSIPSNIHDRIQHRTGTGSQTPPDFRHGLLSALVKLVAYDFGCNVSHPRIEPRLYITPPPNPKSKTKTPPPASSFPTNISFVYRTPTDRPSARSGIVEGPLAALSARQTTGFTTHIDSVLDLAREATAVLVTAQQRARQHTTERKLPDDTWWCHAPRWGGGTGGPIGREAEREPLPASPSPAADDTTQTPTTTSPLTPSPSTSFSPLSPLSSHGHAQLPHSNREKKRKTMTMYDNYRMVRPPSSTWDRKARYLAIGKPAGAEHDDVFLLSCLNHHVCIVRVRVSAGLLRELGGEEGAEGAAAERAREECTMYRSKWYDMFLAAERVEAMTCIWGMMGYLMRNIDEDREEAEKK